jgi:RNA polymerase sigma-70 factor (ECF subfamily)
MQIEDTRNHRVRDRAEQFPVTAGLVGVAERRRLALANNRERLAVLYREHRRYAVHYIARRLEPQHSHAVEDVAQDVFVKAWPSLHRVEVRDESSYRRWLTAVTRNTLANYRAAGRQREETPVAPGSPLWGSEHLVDSSAGRAVEAVEDRVDLVAALSRLPAEHRRVLELRFVHGLNQRALIQQTRHSQATIARLTEEGLSALRATLGVEGQPVRPAPTAAQLRRTLAAHPARRAQVQAALTGMAPEVRQAVQLRVLQGLDIVAAGRVMHHGEDKVRKLTNEGLAAIGKLLNDSEPPAPAAPPTPTAARSAAVYDSRTAARQAVEAARHLVAAQSRPQALQEALAGLPAEVRDAVELRVVHGLSAGVAAARMHCRKARVSELTTEGLAALRHRLTTEPPVATDEPPHPSEPDRPAPPWGDPTHQTPGAEEDRCADALARARVAVAEAHQRVATQMAEQDRARDVARWHAEDQATEYAARQDTVERDAPELAAGGVA